MVAAATFAPMAVAASNPVIQDCDDHGALTRSYSIQQLNAALALLTASEKEYTNCPDVIQRALATAVADKRTGQRDGGIGDSGSGSSLPTPVIIILAVLVLTAITLGAVAVRHRRGIDDR